MKVTHIYWVNKNWRKNFVYGYYPGFLLYRHKNTHNLMGSKRVKLKITLEEIKHGK